MVHNDDSYSPAQKFFYLRSCLQGPALDLVRSIPVSDSNYEVIVHRLAQRYDNHSLVIQSHIRSILDCPHVKKEVPGSLQGLYSTICTHIAALKALKQPVDHWDAWLITVVTSRLDKETAHGWQLHQRNTELPKYVDLEAFLASRCTALEGSEVFDQDVSLDVDRKVGKQTNIKKIAVEMATKRSLLIADNIASRPCACCSEAHRLFTCTKFIALPTAARLALARGKRLCFNCLSPFHTADLCKSKDTCKICSLKHNTLLHFEKQGQKQIIVQDASVNQTDESVPQTSLWAAQGTSHVFLATAEVLVSDCYGAKKKCRAVLDCGSQLNFVSKRLGSLLKLPRQHSTLPISGIGANRVHSMASIMINLESRVNSFNVNLNCQVLPTIAGDLSACPRAIGNWDVPSEFVPLLADPSFRLPGSVDLLIGGGIFFDLLEAERIPIGVGSLCLQASKLGWIITGEVGAVCLLNTNTFEESLENEWVTLESSKKDDYGRMSKANKSCLEEAETLRHFHETSKRCIDGRFVLRLPLKPEVNSLGESLSMAKRRFLSVERRLQCNQPLREAYVAFMEEYERSGHMYEVPEGDTPLYKQFYLPHHPVLKSSSLTTKLRVVFDASAKGSSGISLNDVLKCGPTVQEDLFSILVRFRKYQYVITADVEKMFRQISVAVEDQDLQRIVWRANPSDLLRSYRLATVTYGTTSASFMATQCLVSLADEQAREFPKASTAFRRDFYMDDLLTGADTVEECTLLQTQISEILNSAKLPLRKWCSNSSEILANAGSVDNEPLYIIRPEENDAIMSLGLCWKPTSDRLRFQVVPAPERPKVTKRMLLSDLNKVFDPLGFLTPVLIRGKIFLQQLWQMKVGWDEALSEETRSKWELFHERLKEIDSLSIPRKSIPSASEQIELHGFCDASQEAYGACIYVRSKSQSGQFHAHLLCAKSRVSPLKAATILRLELGGALTLTQLATKVASAWGLEIRSFHLWTDSMVVLGWLNSQYSRLKVYVANRVEQILEVTAASQWNYVQTSQNPADILSRGVLPREMHNLKLWWNGPPWLTEKKICCNPKNVLMQDHSLLPEQRTVKLVMACFVETSKDLITIYSDWQRLVRAIAWLNKFIEYCRTNKTKHLVRYLTVTDLKKAEIILILRAQRDAFHEEFIALSNDSEVSCRSKLRSLRPMLQDGLILVGGRLQNANIGQTRKHPVVLPSNHIVTRLVFRYYHQIMLHCGPQSLLACVRRYYWPLRGRVIARSTVSKCVRCTRAMPTFEAPMMAPIPRDRIQPARAFSTTGVDFAGPVIIRSGIRRSPGKKAWIAVFVCSVTRAIHLEAVEDLTSAAFVASLRRFMARRGKCSTFYSDNGTNFVGVKKDLAIYLKDTDKRLAQDGIRWRFNPPAAPHFGGL